VKVIREGFFAKVGDYIREGWDTETRSIQPPYNYGIVIKTETRRLGPYTQEQIDEKPIRLVHFLTDNGKIIRRYAVHIEVLSETG
jgi:hypothetical protein